MALIGNNSLSNRTPIKQFIGGAASGYRDTISGSGSDRNRHYGGFSRFAATPNGYLHPGSWELPMKSGQMASYVQAQSTVTSSAILFLGRALSGSSSMVISVTNAQLDMIIDMITSGLIQIVSTNASLAASVGMTADATAVISVLSAQLGGIFSVYTNGTISITPTAVLSALAFMEAEAGGPTPLSPEGLAAALWNSSSTTYNDPGTMGALVNAAGGSASPAIIAAAIWDELVVSHTVSGTYGEKVQKLLTLSQFLGLK